MIHATRSSTPLLLIHLPGGQPLSPTPALEDKGEGEEEDIDVEGAVWNAALGGPRGVLGGVLELRREILDGSGRDLITGDVQVKSRFGIWYNGKRFMGLKHDNDA